MLAMFTMLPDRRSTMATSACLQTRYVPLRLTSSTRSHSSAPSWVHRTSAGHARGVDDDVEPAVRAQHVGDRAGHRILVAHVDCCVAVHVEADHNGAFV